MKNKIFLVLGMIAAQSAVSAYAADYSSDYSSYTDGDNITISGTVSAPVIGSASLAAIEGAKNQLTIAQAEYVKAANAIAPTLAAVKTAQAAYTALNSNSSVSEFTAANAALTKATADYSAAVTNAQTKQGILVQVKNRVDAIIKANTANAQAQRGYGERMQQQGRGWGSPQGSRWSQQQGRYGRYGQQQGRSWGSQQGRSSSRG
jgi:hypothetical protein